MNTQEECSLFFIIYCISFYFLTISIKPIGLIFIPFVMYSGTRLFFIFKSYIDET